MTAEEVVAGFSVGVDPFFTFFLRIDAPFPVVTFSVVPRLRKMNNEKELEE